MILRDQRFGSFTVSNKSSLMDKDRMIIMDFGSSYLFFFYEFLDQYFKIEIFLPFGPFD
jgi:hypothetical protein